MPLAVESVACLGDNAKLATGSDDDAVKVWAGSIGQLLRKLLGNCASIYRDQAHGPRDFDIERAISIENIDREILPESCRQVAGGSRAVGRRERGLFGG